MERRSTGLLTAGSTVALNPARAVTSHLRRRYRTHYLPKFRHPRIVFVFDLAILLCAVFLMVLLGVLYWSLPPKPAPLGLLFTSGKIESASPVALEASISVRDGRARDAVSLQWQLPENTEILKADPPIADDNSVYLGSLEPGQTVDSRLVVRFYAPEGNVDIGFRVPDLDGYLDGSAKRAIESSALKLGPLFENAPPLANGKVPLRLENTSDIGLDGISVLNTDPVEIASLASSEDRIVFAVPGIRVSALSHAVPLAEIQAPNIQASSDAILKLEPSKGNKAHFTITTSKPGTVHIYHPAISHPHTKSMAVPAGTTDLVIPLDRGADAGDEWYAVFEGDGKWTNIESSQITTPFEISASARYFAASGDQLGVGPLPPRIDQTTKYWVSIKLSPTQSDISNFTVSIKLPSNVSLTGREALPSGGTLKAEDDAAVWTVPYLAASASGAELDFEIELLPSELDAGKLATLIKSVEASGKEIKSGLSLESNSGSIDTSLPDDQKASGKGIVQ